MADVAAGTMGLLDPRPITPGTLFPTLAVSRIATAAIVSALADAGLICTSTLHIGYPLALCAICRGVY